MNRDADRYLFVLFLIISTLLLSTGCSSSKALQDDIVYRTSESKQGIRWNVADGNLEEQYKGLINHKIEDIGYVLSDPHERVDAVYQKKYSTPQIKGKTNREYDADFKATLDNLGFFTIANDEVLRPLLLKSPDLGAFTPFNLVVTKKVDENRTYVGHITPETMLDIVGIQDETVRSRLIDSFIPLDERVQKVIGGELEFTTYDKLPTKPMMRFMIRFQRPEDIADLVDEFQDKFEETFERHEFIIAGYKNFYETYEDLELPFDRYDAYWVYSLCHFRFSYSIFSKGRPDAAVFAPCSMYMYIEKDSDVLHIGMPTLETWIAVMGITDPVKVKEIRHLDNEIIRLMQSLGTQQI